MKGLVISTAYIHSNYMSLILVLYYMYMYLYNTSARYNSWPLAIFQPVTAFGRSAIFPVNFQYGTVITYKNILSSKNGRLISDPYF